MHQKKKYSKVTKCTNQDEDEFDNENESTSINTIKEKKNKCKYSRITCNLLILSVIIIIISIIIGVYFIFENYKNKNKNNTSLSSSSSNTSNNTSIAQNVWRNPEVLKNENDPDRDTIYGKFIISFKLDCIAKNSALNRDIVKEFLNLFECYELNEDIIDPYPNITDYRIYMEKKDNCNFDDEIQLKWDDYCISYVVENEMIKLASNKCMYRTVDEDLWNLATSSQASGSWNYNMFQYIKYDENILPEMNIYIMDTGIDRSNGEFAGIRIRRRHEASDARRSRLHRHGTGVASVLFGNNLGVFKIPTNSRNVEVIDVRIAKDRQFPTQNMLSGYDFIINHFGQEKQTNSNKICIINMSFGSRRDPPQQLKDLYDLGCIIIAAAGNDNQNAQYFSPASSPYVITVGNIKEEAGNFVRYEKSNYGDSVDIWAPGTNIQVAQPNTQNPRKDTGTSYSAPLVSGIIANIMAVNQDLNFAQIKERLKTYAVYDVTDMDGCSCRKENLPRVQALCKEYCLNKENVCIDYSERVEEGPNRRDDISKFTQCEYVDSTYTCSINYQRLYAEKCWYGSRDDYVGYLQCSSTKSCYDDEAKNDCSEYVNNICGEKNSCEVTINNDAVNNGDPCPHTRKYAQTEMKCYTNTYAVTGYEGAFHLGFETQSIQDDISTFEVCEGKTATFSCQPFQVLRVKSLKYGSSQNDIGYTLCESSGNCDNYVEDTTYIERECEDKNSCEITINNNNIGKGDPCHGIKKYARIELICDPELQPLTKSFTVPTPSVDSLSCPYGNSQIGIINSDISGCGITTCNNRYQNTNIKSCSNKCKSRSDCLSYSWSEINGTQNYPNVPVCTLYDSVKSTGILDYKNEQILCSLISCPYGTTQIGNINSDIIGCGLESCNKRFNTSTIEDCERKCALRSDCLSFSWSPINGNSLFPNKSVCTLYDNILPNGIRGPQQILCKPLSCPYGTISIGGIDATISGWGLTPNDRYNAENIEQCAKQCENVTDCLSFSWRPKGTNINNLDETICTLYNSVQRKGSHPIRGILCQSLSCPSGTQQIGDINDNIPRIQLDSYKNLIDIDECKSKCILNSRCLSFVWAPINGYQLYQGVTFCGLYDTATLWTPNTYGPRQILCEIM